MTLPIKSVLIDVTFFVERARKAFIGAPLLPTSEGDRTFAFGVLRDFIRHTSTNGIRVGRLMIGMEAHVVSPDEDINGLVAILKKLQIPYLHDPGHRTLDLAYTIREQHTHLLTSDERFLQLINDDFVVALWPQCQGGALVWCSPKELRESMGICPRHVPTYLALLDSTGGSPLTRRQAMRLTGSFGDLIAIYKDINKVSSGHVRTKLLENEPQLCAIFADKICKEVKGVATSGTVGGSFMRLGSAKNRRVLMKYGFRSLVASLQNMASPQCGVPGNAPREIVYRAVTDSAGLQQLSALVRASKVCGIDIECDGKDPRSADLLGIAFSIRGGEAHFVPLTNDHLQGISRKKALACIKEILSANVRFVGQNIKYDQLVLNRAGAGIRSIHFDTMLAAYECYGDWPYFNLSYLSKRLLGETIKSYTEVVQGAKSFRHLPLKVMINHGCQDADYALRLYSVLFARLEQKGISEQFFEVTMRRLVRLAKLELNGIAIDKKRVRVIRGQVLSKSKQLEKIIFADIGRVVDLGSQDELRRLFWNGDLSRTGIAPRRFTTSVLERLATKEPLARQIVRLRRFDSRVSQIDDVIACSRGGTVYPIFNQIASRVGLVSSKPSLFGSDGLRELKLCIGRGARDLFPDQARALLTLAQLTKDPLLQVRPGKIPSWFSADAQSAWSEDVDRIDLFLRISVGMSDATLARIFLVDRSEIEAIRQMVEQKHSVMTEWFNEFRSSACDRGYVINGNLKKYFDGLQSADLSRKKQAIEYAARWLIRY